MHISYWPNFRFRSTYEDFFLPELKVEFHIWRFLNYVTSSSGKHMSLSQISVPVIQMKILILVAITKPKKMYTPVKNVMRIMFGLHGLLSCTLYKTNFNRLIFSLEVLMLMNWFKSTQILQFLSFYNSQLSFDSFTSWLLLLKYGYGYGYDVYISP